MDSKFLENMGIAFIRINKKSLKIVQIQKDEFFDINAHDLNELLQSGSWLKDYNKAIKTNQNQVSKPAKVGRKWVSFEAYTSNEFIDLKLSDVSKLHSERLVVTRSIIRHAYLLSNRVVPLLMGISFLIWGVQSWLKHQSEIEQNKDLMLAKELKEERVKWFERMQKQDSALNLQTQLLAQISENLKDHSKQNKIIADLTRFYKSAEEQNLALITDLTVIEYLIPDAGEKLTEIKKHLLSKEYQKINDSIKIEHEKTRFRN